MVNPVLKAPTTSAYLIDGVWVLTDGTTAPPHVAREHQHILEVRAEVLAKKAVAAKAEADCLTAAAAQATAEAQQLATAAFNLNAAVRSTRRKHATASEATE